MMDASGTILKAPARVLACLRPGYLTVLVGYGLGMAEGGIPHDVQMDLVPFDLRMPNSVFTVVLDRTSGKFIGIERPGDRDQDQGGLEGTTEKLSNPRHGWTTAT